ncbi:MAG: hypothetical protein RLZZ31_465 [Actinomycetota bacterium]|jgi:acyl-ACP thioesterase
MNRGVGAGGRSHGLHATISVAALSIYFFSEALKYRFFRYCLGVSRYGPTMDAGAKTGGNEQKSAENGSSSARGTAQKVQGATELLPLPAVGRVFHTGLIARLGDTDAAGRVRTDAIACYLQDVATEDSDDLASRDTQSWVVRRVLLEQKMPIRLYDEIEAFTFCSGMGSRWAERRTTLKSSSGGLIESVTLWIHVETTSGRPLALPQSFRDVYDSTTNGRVVTARQLLEPLRFDDGNLHAMPWWPRMADLDVLDHVNNAVSWAIVEQILQKEYFANSIYSPESNLRFEMEYYEPIPASVVRSMAPLTVLYRFENALDITLRSSDDSTVYMVARVSAAP